MIKTCFRCLSSVTKNPITEIIRKNKIRNRSKRLFDLPEDHDKDMEELTPYGKIAIKRTYVWGTTSYGALGIPEYLRGHKRFSKKNNFRPVLSRYHPVRASYPERLGVTDASCGFGFTLFATENSETPLVGTGLNKNGQIGQHYNPKGSIPLEVIIQPLPIPLPDKTGKLSQVSCGRAHSLICSKKGQVFTMGNNAYGQCGRKIIPNEDFTLNAVPYHVKALQDEHIISVVAGQDHSLFLSDAGKVFSCGWSADGQTGLGHYNNQEVPSQVLGDIQNEKIIKVASSSDCILALNEKGEVFGWGNAEYGQFKLVCEEQQLCNPTYIPFNKIGKIVDIAAGGTNCMILNDKNEVYVWGYGILGKGPEVDSSITPSLIPSTLFGQSIYNPDIKVTKIFCGISSNAAINSNGDGYTWGVNRGGCLGLGDDRNQYFPLKLSIPVPIKKITLGVDHSSAIGS